MMVTPPPHWTDLIERILPEIILLVVIICFTLGFAACGAEGESEAPRILEVPEWILKGVAAVETRSYFRDGALVYVDRRDGAAGEVGPWQMRRCAFAQIGQARLRWLCRHDTVCAEFCAVLYLRWCYGVAGNWRQAVAIYHTGPGGDEAEGRNYLRAVEAAARDIK